MWSVDVELVEDWLTSLDQERRAILLVAGDKAGNWSKWYRANIPVADDRFAEHLEQLRGKGRS